MKKFFTNNPESIPPESKKEIGTSDLDHKFTLFLFDLVQVECTQIYFQINFFKFWKIPFLNLNFFFFFWRSNSI